MYSVTVAGVSSMNQPSRLVGMHRTSFAEMHCSIGQSLKRVGNGGRR